MTKLIRADFRFHHPLRVRYAEVDGQGVAYNAHYLTWYDVGITEYLRAIGHDYPLGGDPATGCDFHQVTAIGEFRAPIVSDDECDNCGRPRRI
ncbi:MAG: acyl-CoA thioesterase, partial [Rhodospirillaceae bacterium]|nr:acyl-CoA thioesterase [Rhodospirillaceae bacterium]